MAHFAPQPHHCAAPTHFVNGGILATLIDCHCICTAMAAGYLRERRPIGSRPEIHYVTGAMSLAYRRPVPIDQTLELYADIAAEIDKGLRLSCKLDAGRKTCVVAEVTAIRVSQTWMQKK